MYWYSRFSELQHPSTMQVMNACAQPYAARLVSYKRLAEAPVLFAKACELFILELTIRGLVQPLPSVHLLSCTRSGVPCQPVAIELPRCCRTLNTPIPSRYNNQPCRYCYTKEEKGKKRTLTREDLCTAAQQTDIFDFLVGVLTPGQKPSYMQQAEAAGVHAGSGGGAGAGAGAASSSAGGYGGMGAGSAADNDDDEMEGDGDEEEEEEGGMDADAAAPGSSSSAGRGQQQQAGRGGYPGASAAAGAAAPYNMVPYASGPKPMPGTKR